MIKTMYAIWKYPAQAEQVFSDDLLQKLAPELLAVNGLECARIAVVDSDVRPAAAKRLESCQPLPHALISVYTQGSPDYQRGERMSIEPIIDAHVDRFSCYRVTEVEAIKNTAVTSGERVFGFCQVVFLQRPPRLTQAEWLDRWQGGHTSVAIETQSTFGYRQNVVDESYTANASVVDAIIEENFPPEAMTSEQAFYGVTNDEDLHAKRTAMLESCARFIDFDKIDVVPMSEYVFLP
jgi:hypothetical protein